MGSVCHTVTTKSHVSGSTHFNFDISWSASFCMVISKLIRIKFPIKLKFLIMTIVFKDLLESIGTHENYLQ